MIGSLGATDQVRGGSEARKRASFLKKNFCVAVSVWMEERGDLMEDTRKVEDISDITVSAKVLGEIIGVGDRMVRNLAEQGVLKRNSHGRYLLLKSVKNYILTLKIAKAGEKVKTDVDSQYLDLNREKAVNEHWKSMINEIRLQLIQGKVHKSEDVEAVITDMFSKFKSKLLALPVKAARRAEGKTRGEIQQFLMDEVNDVLLELSQYNPADYYSDEHICVDADNIFSIVGDDDGPEEKRS